MTKAISNSSFSNESLSFFAHHITNLKQLVEALPEIPRKQPDCMPEIIKGKMLESVTLLEEKIKHQLKGAGQIDFDDYLSDFYELKIEELRAEIVKWKQKVTEDNSILGKLKVDLEATKAEKD